MERFKTRGPTLSTPVWAGDFLSREHLVPGGAKLDATLMLAADGVRVTVGAAGAAADATTVPVAALAGAIPNGTVLDFGGKKFARLTAEAAAGATSLSVAALATALVSGDTAAYPGMESKTVPSGTAIGRTFAERATDTPFGPADAADDEVYLTAFDINDADANTDVELYRHGSIVKENFLPNFASLAAGVVTKIRAAYTTTRGV